MGSPISPRSRTLRSPPRARSAVRAARRIGQARQLQGEAGHAYKVAARDAAPTSMKTSSTWRAGGFESQLVAKHHE